MKFGTGGQSRGGARAENGVLIGGGGRGRGSCDAGGGGQRRPRCSHERGGGAGGRRARHQGLGSCQKLDLLRVQGTRAVLQMCILLG